MSDGGAPTLAFSSIRYTDQQGRHDLRTFLHRGAAGLDVRQADAALKAGKLGPPLMERLPLLRAFHAEMDAALVAGGSGISLISSYRCLAQFFSWIDKKKL